MTLTSLGCFFGVAIISVLSLQNKYCQLSCDFVNRTLSHTVCDRELEKCGPGKDCGDDVKIIELSQKQKQYILELHNYLRNFVAMGWEQRGGQPPAANMKLLKYNNELEFIAQCWANTCHGDPLIHDRCRRTENYEHVGQNLGFISSSVPEIDVNSALKQLIMLWYDEVDIFNKEWINSTQDHGKKIQVGHYTQMVWADTKEIGCAMTYYTSHTTTKWHQLLFVCNYGPGGNYLGLPVYQIGQPASQCNDGEKAHNLYKGLCQPE